MRSATDTVKKNKTKIIGDFAPDKKDSGLAALDKLEASLKEFQVLIDAKDKQNVPIKQRECLGYVGQVEEAMVKGFPFQIAKEYADRPLLMVRRGGGGNSITTGDVWGLGRSLGNAHGPPGSSAVAVRIPAASRTQWHAVIVAHLGARG